ncbi:MAG: PA domain-containing protein [Bacteroidota bacterium]
MKNFTLRLMGFLCAAFLVGNTLNAQSVYVLEPESLFGSYNFDDAQFGAPLTDSVWIGEAVVIDVGGENSSQGCGVGAEVLNAASIEGRIALIDRGSCRFDEKFTNAANAGAIAVVIINNQPGAGAMGMGGASDITDVPVASLSFEDGALIKATLETDTVVMMIGDTVITVDNDVAITANQTLPTALGSIPLSQYDESNPFVFRPGGTISNIGRNEAANAELKATVNFTPIGGEATTVYQDSFILEALPSDSTSDIFLLAEYSPEPELGAYDVTYEVSTDSTETLTNDNTSGFQFNFTERAFSKASWLYGADFPFATIFRTIGGGGEVEFLTGFNVPKGVGFQMDSVFFDVATNAESLAEEFVEAYVYEWVDINEDGGFNADELTIAGFAFNIFDSDETATQAQLRLPLLDFELLEEASIPFSGDDSNYILGLRYRGVEVFFFGFDASVSYNLLSTLNFNTEGVATDLGFGYLGINAWIDDEIPDVDNAFLFTGVAGDAIASALIISQIDSDVDDVLAEGEFQMEMFPNPVSEQLMTKLNLTERSTYLTYQVLDATGKMIFEQRNNGWVQEDQARFNVSTLPQGQYFLRVVTDKGFTTKSFVVQH